MYLKGIEIKGFKSFLDKTVITLEKGMISIVGPNGSGKSNILDAIRWVLGEQSIKSLRGDKLEDVIFSGTQSRSPLGYCEVTLIIDNEDKKADIAYSELSIKRKAYRSGESQFFINNKKCRLKDIREILLDTGIGKEGYSIISQGKVDEIINSSGNQKRALLEEASGITKYRYKKEEGEKNLSIASENLERIKDIYNEIQSQIRPLEIQKEKAEKYLEYSNELKIQEINKFLKSYKELSIDITNIQSKKTEIENLLLRQKNDIETKNQDISKLQDEINFITNRKIELKNLITGIDTDINKNLSEISIKNEGIKNLGQTNEMLLNQINESNSELENIRQKYDTLILNQKNIDIQKNNILELIDDSSSKYDDYFEKNDILSKNIKTYEQKKHDLENELAKLETRMEFQKSNIDSFNEKFAEYDKEISSYEKKIDSLESELKSKIFDIENKKQDINNINDDIKKCELSLNDVKDNIRESFVKINEHNLMIKDLSAKVHILENLENDMQGFSKGIKSIIKNPSLKGVHNVVANIITVKKGYEKAIEQLLSGRLENIVIDKAYQAKELISYLKKENLGRATFLPIDTIKSSYMNYCDEGIKAIDVVEYDSKYENIISNLLAKMIIVDDMDIGLKISQKYSNSFRIATKSGDIFNIGGSISGGSSSFSKEIFTRRNSIKEHKENISKSHDMLLKYQDELSNYQEKEDEIKKVIFEKQSVLEECKNKYNILQNEKISIQSKLSHQKESISQLIEERNTVQYSNCIAIKSYNNDIQNLNKLRESLDEINDNLNKKIKNLDEYKLILEDIKKSINSLEVKKELIIQQLSSIQLNIKETDEALNTANQRAFKSKEKISANTLQIEKYKDIIQSLEKANISLENNKVENLSKLEKISLGEKNISENLKSLNIQKDSLISEQNRVNTEFIKIESEESKLDYKLDLLKENLYSSYFIDIDEAKKYEDENIVISQTTIKNLKDNISSLGNVNLDSIQEFEKVNERYLFYKTQKEDLEESINKINSIIKSLEKSMIQDFKSNFEIINKNFDDIFKILFGGGSGKLILEDENDVLNTNIDISVQPPGKKLRGISMLSGGEKALSAIALLFAIIAKKPVPFCILDEIDAPLDDANIYRYISYLLTLSDTTQFITITHRRITMESSDYIYGVTMQEKGVSDIVSLKLEDAKHYIEE